MVLSALDWHDLANEAKKMKCELYWTIRHRNTYVLMWDYESETETERKKRKHKETRAKRIALRKELLTKVDSSFITGIDLLGLSVVAAIVLATKQPLFFHLICAGVIINFVRFTTQHKWLRRYLTQLQEGQPR